MYLQQGRHKDAQTVLKRFVSQNFPEAFWKDRALLMLKKMETE